MISSFFLLNLVKWNSPNLKDKKVGSKNIHLKPVDTFGISKIFFSEPAPTVVEAGKTYGITLTICGTFENNVYIHYKQSGEEGNSKIYEDPVPSTNQSASRQFTFPQDPPSQDITYIFWLSHSNTPATNPGDSDSASKDFSVTVKTPPKPTINNVPSDSIFTENFDITLNIKAQSTGICYYKIDEGNEQEQPYSGSESSYSATVTVDVSSLTYAQNQHTVTFLRCTDNDKLSGDFPSENNQFQFNIKHQPSISAVNIQNSPVTTNTVQFTITYSDSDTGKPLRLYISNQDNIDSASSLGDQFDSGSTPAEFSYKFIPNNDHDAQEFTYYLWLKDEDSSTSTTNKQSESQSLVFTYNKAPTMDSFTAPDVHAYKNGVEASFTIGVTDDSTGKVVFYLNDINTPILELDYAKGTSTADYKLQIDSTNFPYKSDDYTISIQLKDQYQVSSDALHTFNFKVRNPPAISDLSILQNVYQLGKTDPVQVRFTLTDSDSTKDINIFQKIGDSEKQIDSITGSHESTITREFNLDLQGITAGDYQIYIYASDTDTPPTSNSKSAEVNPVSLTVAPQMRLTLNNIKEFYINPVQIQSTVTLTNLNEGGKFDTKILKGTTVQHSEMDDTYSTTSDPTIDFQVPNDLAAGEYTLQVQAIGDHTDSDIVSKSFRVIIQTSISLTLEDLNEYSEDTDNIPIEGKVSGSGYITLTVQLDEQTQEGITTTISLGDGTKNQEITGLSIPTSSLQKGHQYTLKVIATSSFDSGDYKENNDEFQFIIIRKPKLSDVKFNPSVVSIGETSSLKGTVSYSDNSAVSGLYIHYKTGEESFSHFSIENSENTQGSLSFRGPDLTLNPTSEGEFTHTIFCSDNTDSGSTTKARSEDVTATIKFITKPTIAKTSPETLPEYISNGASETITFNVTSTYNGTVYVEAVQTPDPIELGQAGYTVSPGINTTSVPVSIRIPDRLSGSNIAIKAFVKVSVPATESTPEEEKSSDKIDVGTISIKNKPSIKSLTISSTSSPITKSSEITVTCKFTDNDQGKLLKLFVQVEDGKIFPASATQESSGGTSEQTYSPLKIDLREVDSNNLKAGTRTLHAWLSSDAAADNEGYSDDIFHSKKKDETLDVVFVTSLSLENNPSEYNTDNTTLTVNGKISGSGTITFKFSLDNVENTNYHKEMQLPDGAENAEISGVTYSLEGIQPGEHHLTVSATGNDGRTSRGTITFTIKRKPTLSDVKFEPSIYAIGDETSPRLKGRVSQLYSMDVTKFYIHYRKSDQDPYEHYQLTSTNQQGEFDIPISFNTAGTYTYTVICNDNSDPEASTYAKSDPSNPQIIVTQRPTLTGSFSTSTYYSSNDANSKIKVTYEANDDSSYSVIFEVDSTEVKTITDQTGQTLGSDVEIPIQSFTYNGGHEYQLKVYAKDQHEFTSDSPITKSFKIMNQPSISINIDNPYPRRQDSIHATCTLNDIDNEKPLNLFYQLVQNDNVIRKEKIASNHQSNGQASQTVTVTPITIQANDAFGVSKLKFYMSYLDDLDLQSTNSYANSPVVEKDITITMNPEFEITNQNKFYKTDATQASVSVSYKGLGDLKFKQVTESTETDINVQVPASETDSTLTFMIDIPSGSTYGKKDVTIKLHSSHGYDATKTLSYTILNQPTLANVSVLPENVISGKTVKVTGTVTDADLDGSLQNKKKSYLHIISATSNINFKKEITTTTFSINEEFTVPMLDEASDEVQTEFKVFVSNNEDPNAQVAPEWAKSSETTKQINIIKRPTVVITSTAAEYYEKGASITGTFKTNTHATFTYYFDSNEPKDLGTVTKATAQFSYEISIPDTLTHGKHTLNIVVADKHSYTSVPATLNFTIWNKPKLLSASLAEEKYKAGQLIVISGKVHDNDKDDKLQFYVAFNDREATNAYEHTSSGAEEEFSFNVTTPSNITAGDVNVTIYVVDQDKLESEKLNSTFNLYVKEDKTSEKEGNSDKKKTTIIVVVVIIVCVILIIIVAVIIAKKLKNRKDESSSFSGDSQRMPEYELKNEETIITGGAPQSNVTMDNPLFLSTNTDRNNPFNDTDDAGADSDDHGEDLKENEIVFM